MNNKEGAPVGPEIINPKEKPIHFSFGYHSEGSISCLDDYFNKIERVLQNTNETVLLVLELHSPLDKSAEKIESSLVNGKNLTWSYVKEELGVLYADSSSLKEFLEKASKYKESIEVFRIAELKRIVKLNKKYPDRLSLMIEKIEKSDIESDLPQEIKHLYNEEHDALVASGYSSGYRKKAHIRLNKNDVIDACKYFVEGSRTMELLSEFREKVLIRRIKERVGDSDIGAVFVRFGAGHSYMAHHLHKEGYNITTDFDWKDNNGYFAYDLGNVLSRSIRSSYDSMSVDPEIGVTIFKGLLSEEISKLLLNMYEIKIGSEEHVINVTPYVNGLILKRFKNKSDIHEFQISVNKSGFRMTLYRMMRKNPYRTNRPE